MFLNDNYFLSIQIGLGKTTLAHTIARHAGYTVREINASDDRSPESFRLALQNGTEMQTTLLDQEKRPNCIILGKFDFQKQFRKRTKTVINK